MGHIILTQLRICITYWGEIGEHFVGTGQNLWP